MSFLPLTLGVGRTPEAGGGGSSKPPSKSDSEKIFKRDNYTCRYCGFRSLQYMRISNSSEGLITACSFCEQVNALDRAGFMGSGVLIWLPEISQAELNHIARAIYVARAETEDATSDPSTHAISDIATRALDALMARRTEAKKRLGSDDPLLLGTTLHESLTDKELSGAIKKLDGIRLMPLDKYILRGKNGDVNAFPQMIKFWRSPQGPYGTMPADTWQTMFAKVAA